MPFVAAEAVPVIASVAATAATAATHRLIRDSPTVDIQERAMLSETDYRRHRRFVP